MHLPNREEGGRSVIETITSVSLNFSFGNIFYKSIILSDAIICVSTAQRNILAKAFPLSRSKLMS